MALVQEVKTSKDLQEISHLETVEEEADQTEVDRMALEDQIAEDRMLAVDQVVLHNPQMDPSQTTDSHQDRNLDIKGILIFFFLNFELLICSSFRSETDLSQEHRQTKEEGPIKDLNHQRPSSTYGYSIIRSNTH